VEDVLAAANALLDNLQAGEPMPATPGVRASIDELEGLGYVCDESGCVLVLPGDQQREEGEKSCCCCCTGYVGWSGATAPRGRRQAAPKLPASAAAAATRMFPTAVTVQQLGVCPCLTCVCVPLAAASLCSWPQLHPRLPIRQQLEPGHAGKVRAAAQALGIV
jgi:hypothetical protein